MGTLVWACCFSRFAAPLTRKAAHKTEPDDDHSVALQVELFETRLLLELRNLGCMLDLATAISN